MRFIEMVTGNRPPACKITKVRTGNYSLIWSGLIIAIATLCSTN